MLPTGWTDSGWRAVLLALAVSALTACGTTGRVADDAHPVGAASAATPTPTSEPPSPETEARYDALLVRLRAGDATATADLARFSEEYPGFAGPLLNLGLIRSRAGDEAGARVLFERAAMVCGHCGSVWNELGVLHGRHGRFAEAEEAYQRAIEVEPGFAAAYYNLAIVYELYIPRPELALQNYEQYLQLGGTAGEGQDVQKWVAELRRRVGATPTAARAEGAP
jgi:tetratricopeptide (TPR) repeat protein